MEKISVIIITKNEEIDIVNCLESVKWADEIIIVDSESRDNTISLAKKYTDKIYIKKWTGFAPQKSYALSLASNGWVLSIDADEVITDELKNEILNLDFSSADGYYIKRRIYFLGKLITSKIFDRDYQLRLFRKSKTHVINVPVHEGFEVNGTIKKLNNYLNHFTYSNLHEAIEKINLYSTLSAEKKAKDKKITGFSIFSHSISAFAKFFISYKGYKDKMHGFLVSWLHSFITMQIYMKAWEIQNKKNHD
jgi:glycosyltransferase involved in cell wall biosynthesis